MAGGRSSTPLFELLGEGKGDSLSRRAKSFIPGSPQTPASPQSAPTLGDPTQADPTEGGSPRSPDPRALNEPGSDGQGVEQAGLGVDGGMSGARESTGYARPGVMGGVGRVGGGPIVLTRPQLLIGVGCLVGLLFLVWAIAYGAGGRAEKADWQRDMQHDQRIGPDPLVISSPQNGGSNGPTGGPGGGQARPSGNDGGGGQRGGGGLLGAGSGGFIISAGGVLPKDPRQPGQNYLRLATLPRADAQSAIEFLAAGGVEAIGVPVDPGAGTANNPARYAVFAMVGITGEEYKNRRPVMTDIEAKVARIGERYRREARGPTDFSKPLWSKFNP